MTLAALRDWRRSLWLWYLAAAVVLTSFYVLVPPFKGNAVAINALGLSSVIAIGLGIRMHRPKARLAWGLLLAGQLLYVAGDTYTYTYPELLGGTVGFPSAGDAIYLTLYPVLFCRVVPARQAAQSEARPRRADRLAHPHSRLRAAVVDLPRRPEHAPVGALAACEGRIGCLSARGCPAAGSGDQARRRRRQARTRLLSPRGEHRLPARHRLRLQLCTPRRRLSPPADVRHRLDRLPRVLGERSAPSLDAHAGRARPDQPESTLAACGSPSLLSPA